MTMSRSTYHQYSEYILDAAQLFIQVHLSLSWIFLDMASTYKYLVLVHGQVFAQEITLPAPSRVVGFIGSWQQSRPSMSAYSKITQLLYRSIDIHTYLCYSVLLILWRTKCDYGQIYSKKPTRNVFFIFFIIIAVEKGIKCCSLLSVRLTNKIKNVILYLLYVCIT
jgi:hypothetical protein